RRPREPDPSLIGLVLGRHFYDRARRENVTGSPRGARHYVGHLSRCDTPLRLKSCGFSAGTSSASQIRRVHVFGLMGTCPIGSIGVIAVMAEHPEAGRVPADA